MNSYTYYFYTITTLLLNKFKPTSWRMWKIVEIQTSESNMQISIATSENNIKKQRVKKKCTLIANKHTHKTHRRNSHKKCVWSCVYFSILIAGIFCLFLQY